MSVRIETNDRVFVSGPTGSGKSHWVKRVLWPRMPRVVLYDWKGEHRDLEAHTVATVDELEEALTLDEDRVPIRFRPTSRAGSRWADVCRTVYQGPPTHLICDEAARVCDPSDIEDWHDELLTLGRSRGHGVTHLTQRPRSVHNVTMSEAEHIVSFGQRLDTDRRKLEKAGLGPAAEELQDPPTEYAWLYYRDGTPPQWYAPVPA